MAGKTSTTSKTDDKSPAPDAKVDEKPTTESSAPADETPTTGNDDQKDVAAGDETPSSAVQDDIEKTLTAVEENPDAPEEAIETEYLPGGEIPVNAPGTEGVARA
jgi:hypothetical protein